MAQMKTLAERVEWCLANATPKQSKVAHAKAIGVTRHTIYLWLDGTSKDMTPEVSRKAADHFGVRREWLESGTGNPRRNGTRIEPDAAHMRKAIRAEQDLGDPWHELHRVLKALHVIDDDETYIVAEVRKRHEHAVALMKHLDEIRSA